VLESCVPTLPNIVFHSETRESNPKNRALGLQRLHQINATASTNPQVLWFVAQKKSARRKKRMPNA
jgi:hypothetical protein